MTYDLTIIGAGWAGINAALKAKEAGLKTCLIEKGEIGGTCLNLGCIPTKILIQSAKVYSAARKAAAFGVEISNPKFDFGKIQERKEKIIRQLRQAIETTLKNTACLKGEAKIISGGEIGVGGQTIKTKFTLIASGSRPAELPNIRFDGRHIISSDDILNLKEIPASLLIIGGGVIGCEFASIFSSFGSRVSIIEKEPQLLPGIDSETAKKLEGNFKKKGIIVKTNTDAQSVNLKDYDLVLLCTGRRPNIEGWGIDKIDEYLKTNRDGVYAAGDCASKVMLAHFAAYTGRLAVENMANPDNPKKVNSKCIPSCIFTEPEIACVGLSEEAAKEENLKIKISKFDFMGSGMARILDETEGFIKIISDQHSGQIVGASIIGPRATELIGILTLAISNRLKISQIQETIFAHPTLSEAINETLQY